MIGLNSEKYQPKVPSIMPNLPLKPVIDSFPSYVQMLGFECSLAVAGLRSEHIVHIGVL